MDFWVIIFYNFTFLTHYRELRCLLDVGGGIKDVRHTETFFKECEKERKGVKFVKMNRRKNRKTTQRV
jgi:hypothetical protein